MVVPMIPFHLIVGTPDSCPRRPHTQQLVIQLENRAASEHEGGEKATDGSREKQDSDAASPLAHPSHFKAAKMSLETRVCVNRCNRHRYKERRREASSTLATTVLGHRNKITHPRRQPQEAFAFPGGNFCHDRNGTLTIPGGCEPMAVSLCGGWAKGPQE